MIKYLVKQTRPARASLIDRWLGIRTAHPRDEAQQATRDSSAAPPPSLFDDGVAFESPEYFYLRKVRNRLQRRDLADEVFVDLGAGTGRVLCVMAQLAWKQVMGVELDPQLCARARKNAEYLKGKRTAIEVVCQDAAQAELSAGTTYFLFNPFGAKTLKVVLQNIQATLDTHPRCIRFVYYNSKHEELFHGCDWLEKYDSFRTFNGLTVSFWQSVRQPHEVRHD